MPFDDIFDSDNRKISTIKSACKRVDTEGGCRAIMRTNHVRANDKIMRRVKKLAFSYHAIPPICCLAVARKRMENPNDIVLFFIERPVSVICNIHLRQFSTTFQRQSSFIVKNFNAGLYCRFHFNHNICSNF